MLTNTSLSFSKTKAKHKNEKKISQSISWSQLLLPSYKTRLKEFRKQFKTVPNNERLVSDFACALQKEILIQGRLYLSVNYLAFHANIFGWETVVTIKLCDITTLNKANTIRVIPNAIQIVTCDGNKYIFTSFVARDKAFKRLYRLWQDIIIGQKMSVSEVWQLIHYNYGSDLGVPSDSDEGEEEISIVVRNNSMLHITEEEINTDNEDEVFDEPIKPRFERRDSMSSFLTCPETDTDEELRLIASEDFLCINPCIKKPKPHNLSKFNHWLNGRPLESLYLKILLVISFIILFMHLVLLYKLYKIDLTRIVNINELNQLVDLTNSLISKTKSLV